MDWLKNRTVLTTATNNCVTLVLRVSREMMRDDVTHLAAGVSYFAIFSLFPILLGFMVVGGIVLDSEVARQEFLQYISGNHPGSEKFLATVVPVVEQNMGDLAGFRGDIVSWDIVVLHRRFGCNKSGGRPGLGHCLQPPVLHC